MKLFNFLALGTFVTLASAAALDQRAAAPDAPLVERKLGRGGKCVPQNNDCEDGLHCVCSISGCDCGT